MAYGIRWSPKAREGLAAFPKETALWIISKVEGLRLAPYHFVEKMSGVNCWKLRVGDYRALLDISEEKKELQVLNVGHRKNVYK